MNGDINTQNERILLEKLREINPMIGAVIQALLITQLDEEVLLQTIYELDDMSTFKRWGEIKIMVEDGNVTRVIGQRSHLINRPLRKAQGG